MVYFFQKWNCWVQGYNAFLILINHPIVFWDCTSLYPQKIFCEFLFSCSLLTWFHFLLVWYILFFWPSSWSAGFPNQEWTRSLAVNGVITTGQGPSQHSDISVAITLAPHPIVEGRLFVDYEDSQTHNTWHWQVNWQHIHIMGEEQHHNYRGHRGVALRNRVDSRDYGRPAL